MFDDLSTGLHPFSDSTPLTTWAMGETAWLVGAAAATPDERARALPAARAVSFMRWSSLQTSDAVLQALELGQLLLVVRSSRAALDADQPESELNDRDPAEAEPLTPEPQTEQLHRIDVQVVSALGEPQTGIAYELTLPDGSVRTGRTDADGYLRIGGLPDAGSGQLTFPELPQPEAAA